MLWKIANLVDIKTFPTKMSHWERTRTYPVLSLFESNIEIYLKIFWYVIAINKIKLINNNLNSKPQRKI